MKTELYHSPQCEVLEIQMESVLCASVKTEPYDGLGNLEMND